MEVRKDSIFYSRKLFLYKHIPKNKGKNIKIKKANSQLVLIKKC